MTEDHSKDSDQSSEDNPAGHAEKAGPNNEQPAAENDRQAGAMEDSSDTGNAALENPSETSAAQADSAEEIEAVEDFDLNLLLDIPLEITVELGRNRVRIQELLELEPGSTVTLSKLEGEPVDILANDKLIARGEVVLQNKKYGIRITEITSRMNRIKSLH